MIFWIPFECLTNIQLMETVIHSCSIEKLLQEVSQISQEGTFSGDLILIRLNPAGLQLY